MQAGPAPRPSWASSLCEVAAGTEKDGIRRCFRGPLDKQAPGQPLRWAPVSPSAGGKGAGRACPLRDSGPFPGAAGGVASGCELETLTLEGPGACWRGLGSFRAVSQGPPTGVLPQDRLRGSSCRHPGGVFLPQAAQLKGQRVQELGGWLRFSGLVQAWSAGARECCSPAGVGVHTQERVGCELSRLLHNQGGWCHRTSRGPQGLTQFC